MTDQPAPFLGEFQVLDDDCPSRAVLDHVTGRWGPLVVLSLHGSHRGPALRFSEVRRAIGGINDKALAQVLRHLERDGLVSRHASDGFPSRVEYRLTEVGDGMETRLRELAGYLQEQMPVILERQAGYDARQERPATAAN